MPTTILHTSTALASEPNYDGTEDISPTWADGTWGRPNLSDFPGVDEEDTWDDLDADARQDVADAFIDGTADAETYGELSYPVVNPETGNLNRNGVRAALSRAAAEDDSEVEEVARDLWEEHWEEEEATDKSVICTPGGPTVVLEKTGDTIPSEPEPPQPSDKLQTLRSRAQSGKKLSADFKSRRTERLDATESRLERINSRHSDIDLSEDDVALFRDYAVHNLPPQEGMRRPLQFTTGALRKFRDDYRQGRTMNLHHDGERQVGSTFDAELRTDEEVRGVTADWLVVDWYAPTLNASEQRLQDITDMQSGVLRYTSIEFAGGDWQEQTVENDPSSDTRSGSGFFYLIDDNPDGGPDRLYSDGIARVALGAVKGAGSS